jgi:hypothetical protein
MKTTTTSLGVTVSSLINRDTKIKSALSPQSDDSVSLSSPSKSAATETTASPVAPFDHVLAKLKTHGYKLVPNVSPKGLEYDNSSKPMMRNHMDFEPTYEKQLFWCFMLVREIVCWGLSFWARQQYLKVDNYLLAVSASFDAFYFTTAARGVAGLLLYGWFAIMVVELGSYYCFWTGHPLVELVRKYDFKPQFILPNGLGAFPFPRTVRSPFIEFWEFYLFRTPTYIYKVIRTALFYVLWGTLRKKPIRFISDAELGRFLTATYYSHFLSEISSDSVPKEALERVPQNAAGSTRWYAYDVSQQMEYLAGSKHHWSGFYIVPNKSYYYRVDEDALVPAMIAINGLHITPAHTNAWKLAKVHVGLNFLVEPLYTHPKHHFAYDFAAARMLCDVPYEHNLRRLLEPHTYNTIELNNVVLNHPNTPLKPDWWKTYTPFTVDFSLQLGSIVNGLIDWKFVVNPIENKDVFNLDFPFAKAMQEYYFCMQRYVLAVEPSIPRDQYVGNWIKEIHSYVPGFPNVQDMFSNRDLFVSVVANIMFTLSVGHCCDHIFEGLLDTTWSPNRVRIPPPSSLTMGDFAAEDVCNHWDMLKVGRGTGGDAMIN